MIHHFPATILKKNTIAENTVEMTFSVSDPSFTFLAGQYVSIEIPSLSGESIPDRYHNFSIASSPNNPKEISIVFRVSQSIYKTTLLALPLGSMVNVNGPKGVLVFPEPVLEVSGHMSVVPVVLVAGGIGIAPFMSQILQAVETNSSRHMVLMYFNVKIETTAYRQELIRFAQQNPNFILEEYFGVPSKESFAHQVQDMQNAEWYVVGAPNMVSHVEQILIESGIMETRIKIEGFSGYANRGEIVV